MKIPVEVPSAVTQSTVWLAIQMMIDMINVPEKSVRNRLPLWMPTAMAMKKPMVTRSPKGRTRLPGMMIARSSNYQIGRASCRERV